MKIQILHASMSGTTKMLAEAIAEGAKQVKGAEVLLQSVDEVDIDTLKDADAIVIGSPSIFSNVSPKMAQFLYRLGGVWMNNELIGKVGGVFATSSNQHWGIENILRNLQLPLQAMGMNIVSNQVKPEHTDIASPYGASAICKIPFEGEDKKDISPEELDNARHYGKQIAQAAARMGMNINFF